MSDLYSASAFFRQQNNMTRQFLTEYPIVLAVQRRRQSGVEDLCRD
jgi:hypothetical protein